VVILTIVLSQPNGMQIAQQGAPSPVSWHVIPPFMTMYRIGDLSGKQAAALAGLAPISRQSGKWQGKERIQGGRASVRHAVYLPAIVAPRFNPDMKAKYEQLISTGKCTKLAITAVMRKLIVMANALLRDQRKWTQNPA